MEIISWNLLGNRLTWVKLLYSLQCFRYLYMQVYLYMCTYTLNFFLHILFSKKKLNNFRTCKTLLWTQLKNLFCFFFPAYAVLFPVGFLRILSLNTFIFANDISLVLNIKKPLTTEIQFSPHGWQPAVSIQRFLQHSG